MQYDMLERQQSQLGVLCKIRLVESLIQSLQRETWPGKSIKFLFLLTSRQPYA